MIKYWLLAFRPKTLTAAIIPILAATALAHVHFKINWLIVACALLSAIAIQIATNLINDYIDFDKGADTHERLGPQRVTQSGVFSRQQVKMAALAMILIAVAFGAPLVYLGGWVIALIGVISLLMAYAYTGGPLPLAYVGLGDAFVILFFGVISTCGVYFLHTRSVSLDSVILGLQVGFFAAVLIAINNLRDVEQDKTVNKKTLAVRFGPGFVRAEIFFLVTGAFALQAYWAIRFGWLVALLPLILLPLAFRVVRRVAQTEPSRVYNQFLAQSAALHAGFGLILSLSLLLE